MTKPLGIMVFCGVLLAATGMARAADDRASVLKSWIARGVSADKRVKELRAKAALTPKERCEVQLDSAYAVAPLVLRAAESTEEPLEPVLAFGEQAAITFSYGRMGKMRPKVQTVLVFGNFQKETQFLFGGELARKGDFILKSGACLFLFNDMRPLEGKVVSN